MIFLLLPWFRYEAIRNYNNFDVWLATYLTKYSEKEKL